MAARLRPRKLSPVCCRMTSVPRSSAPAPSAKLRADHHPVGCGQGRIAVDHRPIFHAIWSFNPSERHRARHKGALRSARRSKAPTTPRVRPRRLTAAHAQPIACKASAQGFPCLGSSSFWVWRECRIGGCPAQQIDRLREARGRPFHGARQWTASPFLQSLRMFDSDFLLSTS